MSTDDMSWFFREADHSAVYFKYRPRPPDEVYELIFKKLRHSFARLSNFNEVPAADKFDLAVDVGCGPGTGSLPLVKYFNKIIAIDASESQIVEAKKNHTGVESQKITFICQEAENFSHLLEPFSVDLVTVIVALHWFDRQKFYEECNKVLKPGGLLVAICYGKHYLENQEADKVKEAHFKILPKYFFREINYYKDNRATLTDELYTPIFPEFFQHFQSSERDDSVIVSNKVTLEEYIGYLSSYSHYRKYASAKPRQQLLSVIRKKLRKIFPGDNPPIEKTCKVAVLIGRKA